MMFELQEQIGKYPLVREIGSGATSSVYLALDPLVDREVAIKVFMFDKDADPRSERMKHKAFVAEAMLAGKLNHPHIVDIFDAVVEPGRSYLVMEHIPGGTLKAHADVTRLLPLPKVVEIIFKCIRALDYAFQHGVIHRDVKPENILMSSLGEAKVSDFGASFQQRRNQDTTQMLGVGSPAYMSPEQVRMEPLNQQTDIYSLGVTMYQLLTGRLPYQATTQASMIYAILNVPPVPPLTLRPELPPLLDRIVLKAMRKERDQRYPSWLEFGKDLSQAFTTLRLIGETASDSERFNDLREMPFFEDLDDVELWEVVRIGAWKTLPAGTVIIREGDDSDCVFVLVAGEVAVSRGARKVATISPGQCFGEMIYFTNRTATRTATVTAAGEVTVIEIKALALRAATDACQVGFNKAVIRVLIQRQMNLNRPVEER